MTNLYLPITSQQRELDAKLLLALFAKERGMNPVFGYKSAFQARIASLEPGYFLAHNARQNIDNIKRVQMCGHQLVVLDEEALVRQSDEIFLKKHPEGAFDHVDHVLCWGQDDREMWDRAGLEMTDSIGIVGNPRMDLLRGDVSSYFAASVAAIHARYGEYVLLNTNFPTVNNLTPQGGGVRMAQWAMDARGKRVASDFLANKKAMFEAELALVVPLARAIAPLTLLIRPHPNEDHAPWHDAVAGLQNAHVAFDGGVVPWILGARALVHNGCTTAVEAAVAATPVLNFRPWTSEFDNPLAHAVGQDCTDHTALAGAIQALSDGRAGGPGDDKFSVLSRHVASVTGRFSCERIVEFLCTRAAPPDTPSAAEMRNRQQINQEIRRLRLKRFVQLHSTTRGRRKRRHIRKKYPQLKIRALDFQLLKYGEQQIDLFMRQFPPLTEAGLDGLINEFATALGRFSGLRAVQTGENMFTIR